MSIFNQSKKQKQADVINKVRNSLWNVLVATGENVKADDPELATSCEKISKEWLDILPEAAINDCQPATLAGFILLQESCVHSDFESKDASDIYLESAKLATKGIGLRAASGQLHDADFKILQILINSASKHGLSYP